ncbi:glutamate ABC transporter substrate-binding protein [Tsukamurella sp. 8F]|uniref:glutamate ABC transporter substrate-binding protein n=1 Tax=unclassified Tsukamurella TaxID=2633480 RepID=UPI0023B967B7|nr:MULTISPECIES: glutamate ABC transporter substrate-binding protein [unclassified Tsukamurella]MDF0529803.1 glutamate ABC transporter substrate-binding protein [Tsukamurella sp. 8J]MDF0586995.1 glutamate ABC transporter substrate-binding protein [Tsukamurella sp. 8F]
MKRSTIAVGTAVMLTLAACGSRESAFSVATSVSAGAPSPAGATQVRSLPGTASDTSCGDPTASYRPSTASGPGLAAIRARGRLIAGVDQNTFQFGYRNPVSGNLEGFDIDIARAVAQAVFGRADAIQFRVVNSANRIDAVKNHDVDIVVETMTMNCARWRDVAFSSVYYQAGQRVLVAKDSKATSMASLGGRRVCAAAGSTSIQNIVDAPSKPVGIQVPGWTDCLVMMQQNQVDAISTDDTILAGLAAQDPFTKIVGPPMTSEPYGIAVAKDHLDLVRFVNSVLDRMRSDGQWATIYNHWLASLLGGSAIPPTPKYRD